MALGFTITIVDVPPLTVPVPMPKIVIVAVLVIFQVLDPILNVMAPIVADPKNAAAVTLWLLELKPPPFKVRLTVVKLSCRV